jgi:hypothetical protein
MKCFFKVLKITNLNWINTFSQKINNLQISTFQIEKPYKLESNYCEIFGFNFDKVIIAANFMGLNFNSLP